MTTKEINERIKLINELLDEERDLKAKDNLYRTLDRLIKLVPED